MVLGYPSFQYPSIPISVYSTILREISVRHCSISHFGVLVSPHIPTLCAFFSHSGSISSGPSIWYELLFTFRHSLYSTFPLLDFLPETNIMRSCCSAKLLILSMRFATCRHIVSKLLKVCPSSMCSLMYPMILLYSPSDFVVCE